MEPAMTRQFQDAIPQSYAFTKMVRFLNEPSIELYLADGSEAEEKGFYYIVDGSHNILWIKLMDPSNMSQKTILHIYGVNRWNPAYSRFSRSVPYLKAPYAPTKGKEY
jgi:hypothetical protein